jgi:acyl-coenzyme A thioesterase PaaI-like protein
MAELSIQETLYPDITCFGCGHANPDGLRIRSYREGDLTVCRFTSAPHHDNGFGFLNGGIIATVLDCHSAAVVMWEANERGWEADAGAPIPFITSGVDVRFLRPTPLAEEVLITGLAEEIDETEMVVAVELLADDKVRAAATATWRRFHPR